MTRRYNKYENYLKFIGEDKSPEEFGDFLILKQRKNSRAQIHIQISLIISFFN